jgi:hypothetical protein
MSYRWNPTYFRPSDLWATNDRSHVIWMKPYLFHQSYTTMNDWNHVIYIWNPPYFHPSDIRTMNDRSRHMDENLASFIHPILLLQTRKKKGEIFYGNENLFLGLPILTYGVCSPSFLSVQFMTSSCFILRSARPTPPVWASTSVYHIHHNVLTIVSPSSTPMTNWTV